jgi:tRNA G26 N,N-dimethylase Trm1
VILNKIRSIAEKLGLVIEPLLSFDEFFYLKIYFRVFNKPPKTLSLQQEINPEVREGRLGKIAE